MSERVLRGAPASPGLAAGHARVLSHPSGAPAHAPVPEAEREAEADQARAALAAAGAELQRIAASLRESGRDDDAEIVETGALMAADPALESTVRTLVLDEGAPAAAALLAATEEHAALIAGLTDPLLAARADDVRSLGRRAARIASGAPDETRRNGSTFILVAEDLGPADVAEHGDQAAGIALSGGAVNAHAAIVARSLGIPMMVQAGEGLLSVPPASSLVVDGDAGEVVLGASAARLEAAESASSARAHARAKERDDSALPAITADGRRIRVLVNAATAAEVAAGLAAGAEGAGLIRTELAFLDATRWPSRAEHARMLRPLLARLHGSIATVRVLDFGGDKLPAFLGDDLRRGMELLLAHPGAFRAQLVAIGEVVGGALPSELAGETLHSTASSDAPADVAALAPELRVLLPLVRDLRDVAVTRAILDSIGAPLSLGAMIELPEAAAAAREIASECDFLSIGTNDLTHATLGTDRFAHGEAPAHDPRVLRHIASAAEAAKAAAIPLEVCGEAASDPLTAPLLVGLGADELSVGAARVGTVRAWIRSLDYAAAAEIARQALEADDAATVEELARPLTPLS
jgi:phosphoenolpyruvate-protein kinase (PTS system EI component)